MKKSGELKLFLVILAVAVLLVAAVAGPALLHPNSGPHPPPPPVKLEPVKATRETLIPAGTPMRGNPKAPYTLVEFGDYECPTCGTAHTAFSKMMKNPECGFNLVFHHYHVPNHVHSPTMARAAAAAVQQGKFWEMHDKLFNSQAEFRDMIASEVMQAVTKDAAEVGMDALSFRSVMDGAATTKYVEDEEKLATRLGVDQTPTFYWIRPNGEIWKISSIPDMQERMKKDGIKQ